MNGQSCKKKIAANILKRMEHFTVLICLFIFTIPGRYMESIVGMKEVEILKENVTSPPFTVDHPSLLRTPRLKPWRLRVMQEADGSVIRLFLTNLSILKIELASTIWMFGHTWGVLNVDEKTTKCTNYIFNFARQNLSLINSWFNCCSEYELIMNHLVLIISSHNFQTSSVIYFSISLWTPETFDVTPYSKFFRTRSKHNIKMSLMIRAIPLAIYL
jgi:hypothetical protein